ncbi:MAG: TonB-dependent receptor domain-containing protein [Bryobacteraceae bacterium]
MPAKWILIWCSGLIVALAAAWAMFAVQHEGVVTSGGIPLPGATVTATQGDKRLITTTDDHGAYSFSNLGEGTWTIEVEMFGFQGMKREIDVSSPSRLQWDLKLLSDAEVQAALAARSRRAAPEVAEAKPAPPATPTPAAETPKPAAETVAGRGAAGRTPAAPQPAAAAERSSQGPRQAQAARGARGRGSFGADSLTFQEVGVNQAADASLFRQEGTLTDEMTAELSTSAAQALVVQGSMSSALGIPGQNDWGMFGRGMMGGPDMMMAMAGRGMEGPMGMMGLGADGQPLGQSTEMAQAGGPVSRGGVAGGPMMGGPGGRGPAGGGRGGIGGGPGGRGMAGGRGGPGRGMPEWMGRGGALAFGNNLRDPRMRYTGNLSINESNSLLNAQSFSLSGQNIPKPYSNSTTVNLSLGGPLKIPKLLSGNRGQFTVNVGVGRSRVGQQGTLTTMPTELERAGDFSQSLASSGQPVVIYDPSTGAPFPGNVVPPSRQDPIAKALLDFYPRPNLPGQIRNFQLPTTRFNNTNSVNTRLNQTISTRDRLSGGFSYSGSNNTNPSIFGFTDTGSGRGISANLSYSHNFGSRRVLTLNYNFSRNRNLLSPFFSYRDNVAERIGIQGVSTDPLNWGPPTLNFTNFAGLSDAAASLTRNQTSAVGASFLAVHKTHNISFGFNYRRQQNNRYSDTNGRGAFSFNGYVTSALVNGVALPGTGFDLADFLLGKPTTATVRYGNPSLYFRGSLIDVYVHDDWRITSRLSVVLGFRWDYQSPVIEIYDRIVNLDIAPLFTAVAQVLPGQTGPLTGRSYSRALINSDANNLSPRLGIAWRPSAKHSTVLRAGYGVYFNSSVYSNVASQMSQQPPLAVAYNLNIQQSPLLRIADAFTNPANVKTNTLTTNTFAVDPNYRIGYVQGWNFAIQQNLPFSFQTIVSYQGSKGTNLNRQFLPWVTPPNAPAAPYPTGYVYQTFGGNSIYHAGSIQLIRRFRAGLSAGAGYVFSKSIDDGGAAGGANQAQNWLDFRSERGLSSFDQRHAVNINFSYSTGQGRRGGGLITGWKGHLLKDWSIMGQIQIASSNPMTATVGGNQVSRGAVSQTLRADATGIPLKPAPAGYLFNPQAFAVPAPGRWGNAGRNIIPGPMLFSLNASAGRVFRLGERRSLDLQLRANNALNTVVINRWNTQLNTNTFALPTGVAPMRSVTSMLRLRF